MIPGVYLGAIACLAPLLAIFAAAVFSGAGIGAAYALISSILFVLTGLIWIQLIILTACRDFKTITYQFAIGFIISSAISITLGTRFGLIFYLAGFTAGILYIFRAMHIQILTEFKSRASKVRSAPGISKINKYLPLIGVGFLFNAGIWADKFVFWFIGGNRVCGFLYENSVYDRMNLVLIVILIPVMAVFTLTVETDFYVKFRNFYKSIVEKESLDSINLNLSNMKRSIFKGANSILKVTLPLAFLIMVFSRQIIETLKMPVEYQLNWCVFTLAAVIHAFFMLSLILLMYYDFLSYTLRAVIVFFTANVTINLLGALFIGPKFMGYGFLIAVTAGFSAGAYYLKDAIDNLLYHTFSRERVPGEIVIKRSAPGFRR